MEYTRILLYSYIDTNNISSIYSYLFYETINRIMYYRISKKHFL